MDIGIRKLEKKDNSKAIQFAIKGMHFDWYPDSALLLRLYGRYFWYTETNRVTQVITVYQGDTLAGVLLAEMKGEQKTSYSIWKALYVWGFDFLQQIFFQNSAGIYDKINRQMFEAYCQSNSPESEIIFLAANPDIKTKGIGSRLLQEFTQKKRAGRSAFTRTAPVPTSSMSTVGLKKPAKGTSYLNLAKKRSP